MRVTFDDLIEAGVALALTPSVLTATFWAGIFFVCLLPEA